jgi:acetyl CoA:N6-hydroxylysine acetyl transferase
MALAAGRSTEIRGYCAQLAWIRGTRLLAAIESAFIHHSSNVRLELQDPFSEGADKLPRSAVVLDGNNGKLAVSAKLFWQQPRSRLVPPQPHPVPQTYVLSRSCRRLLRLPKRADIVYQRHIPWLDRTLSSRTVGIEQDLERFNRCMDDRAVAIPWREEGKPARHRAYLQAFSADPHLTPLIANFDGEDFGYFEVYWAKENRIAPFHEVDDFDHGWHVLIGGKPFVAAWLPSILISCFSMPQDSTRCH